MIVAKGIGRLTTSDGRRMAVSVALDLTRNPSGRYEWSAEIADPEIETMRPLTVEGKLLDLIIGEYRGQCALVDLRWDAKSGTARLMGASPLTGPGLP